MHESHQRPYLVNLKPQSTEVLEDVLQRMEPETEQVMNAPMRNWMRGDVSVT
jgi:hypothetical protein